MPHHWQPNNEQLIFSFVIIGHTTTDNWQNDGWHCDSMTMSQDNDGTACYLHGTHTTYPHPPPLSDIEPRCHIAVSNMATIQQTIDFHPCSLHGMDTAHPHQMLRHWQPFNKQLISTCPVACTTHTQLTPTLLPLHPGAMLPLVMWQPNIEQPMLSFFVVHGTGTGWGHSNNSQRHTTIVDRYTSSACRLRL